MAKGDSQFASPMNNSQQFMGGSNLNMNQGGSIGPSSFMPQNMIQKLFASLGGAATPQQPYTQSAMQQAPIAPTNPQNISATFFKNLGAY